MTDANKFFFLPEPYAGAVDTHGYYLQYYTYICIYFFSTKNKNERRTPPTIKKKKKIQKTSRSATFCTRKSNGTFRREQLFALVAVVVDVKRKKKTMKNCTEKKPVSVRPGTNVKCDYRRIIKNCY